MDYQALHNDPADLEQWRQIVASSRSKASVTHAQQAPGEPVPATEEPPLVRQPTASDFSEAAVLGRRGQPARVGWRHALIAVTGGRLRLPPGMGELRRNQLMNRVRTPFEGTRRIVVMSRKGGVGKTTVTVGVGSTFASLRGDRVVAVDANPDAGNLAHRIAGDCQRTITDLLADSGRIRSFANMRGYTSQCSESRLEVLASDDDARIAQALDRDSYGQVVSLLDHFYNLILLDTGTGILDSANQGLINEADQLVLVVRPALDGAKVGAQTLDWLEEHGHEDLVRSAVVVVNGVERETDPIVGFTRKHFESRCRHVTMVPWDRTLEAGGRTTLSALQRKTRQAFVDVAAAIADGFSEEPLAYESRETATHGFTFGPLVREAPAPPSHPVPAPVLPPEPQPAVVQPPPETPVTQPAPASSAEMPPPQERRRP
jgi:MinD-like ATPase involved in chromosome partitioning or flagellar assembly